ncbi:TolC family protein [Flagellimonas marinaquae]|uniref:TolC family protein n=1 Tax=Flagellimonas aurea TaxID=2915619 RepID=A0ABS3G6K1_9FLAO|nr:TolC family protein [Allomuricauda aurea]MAO18635.1 transporter [Allomuricauda sp.]MBO0355053.1 TolC family protein [Allomuricauda aurea]UBZ12615.1 TolC family protein [Allomuricauda aquimarina]|tara:strand:- start:441 stop:1790 length:1350 start_codon:yes stop_codon:yes gene_type:complete
MKNSITILLALFAVTLSSAQVRQWTLQECVEYAVENNLTVEQFELDLENAKIDKSDAVGNMLPSLNGTMSASSNTGFSINPTNNLPTNSTANNVNISATSSITLFDGLRNINQLHRAKMNAIANQYRLDNLKDDIRLNVANAYLQVVSNKEQLKTFRAQYAVTEQDLKRTKELVESGVVPRGDLLEIEATAANQEQQIVNGESNVLISRINLAQLLQITDYENFDIAEEEFDIPPSDILDNSPKVIFDKAMTFRNDIKFSESNVELAEQDVKIAKGAYLPTLSAFFQYGTRYSDVTQIPDGNGVPYTPSLTDQLWIFDGISYGAQLNIPIFNGWSTRNNVTRSQISLEKAKLQLEQDKLDLENTIQQAYVDVNTFEKAYAAAEKTLEARTLAYDYAKERYDVGLMNAFDFSQAQARVENAQADVIRTKYDYIFRLKILEFYFGIPISLN